MEMGGILEHHNPSLRYHFGWNIQISLSSYDDSFQTLSGIMRSHHNWGRGRMLAMGIGIIWWGINEG